MYEKRGRRLTSWKEIADHMGRDVRTMLRWEKGRGLPIHRVPGVTGRVANRVLEGEAPLCRQEERPYSP